MSTTFKDLGKKAADLFKKNFSKEHEFQAKYKLGAGNEASVTGTAPKGNPAGKFTGKFKDSWGKLEANVETAGKASLKLDLDTGCDCTNFKVTGTANEKKRTFNAKYEFDYTQDSFVATTCADVGKNSAAVEVTSSYTMEGVTLGGQVKANVKCGKQEVTDMNLGVQWAEPSYTLALKTSNFGNTLEASVFNTFDAFKFGSSLAYNPTPKAGCDSYLLTLGTQYQVDKSTFLKAKVLTSGQVNAAVVHKMADPNLELGFSGGYSQNSKAPLAFGINITYG
jgi:hypothetical protein